MDVEVGESRDDESRSYTQLNGTQSSTEGSAQKLPTPFTSFYSKLLEYKAVVLFTVLAIIFAVCGVTVYFSTVRDDEYYLCCKEWINIHLVPHSHDDVGWLRTPESYYEHTVKYILNNVIYELEKDPSRKFTYVEIYFFWRWWNQQSTHTQNSVRRLIYNGQLEFAGGGWTMSDEATPNYLGIIDQYTWGLRRLNDTFGGIVRPTVGWQIDTFGHSREYVSLLSLMGFSGLFFARIDEEDRSHRRSRLEMEFVWEDREGAHKMLTSVMYKHYNPPKGFHFEKESNEGSNIDLFVEKVREQAAAYRTHNVLVPMGDDFTYSDAKVWFDNMDAMIRKVEARKGSGLNVNMFYSTPLQYLNAIRVGSVSWPVKQGGDLFPYSSDVFSFWSGYFTSRPSLKYFERICANFMQMSKQILSYVGANSEMELALTALREAHGMILHHDGITGTAKQDVTDHYVQLLNDAFLRNVGVVREGLKMLSERNARAPVGDLTFCQGLNISECWVSEQSQKFMVVAYNTLSWPVSRSIRLPILQHISYYTVRNASGHFVPSQIIPLPLEIRHLPGRVSAAEYEVVFMSGLIPPLGFMSFYITATLAPAYYNVVSSSNTNIELEFHNFTKQISAIIKNGKKYPMQQDVGYYQGSAFWTGAYIFRPSDNYPYKLGDETKTRKLNQGPVVEEFHQSFGPWASQSVRLYRGSPLVEIDWLVGPIPIE